MRLAMRVHRLPGTGRLRRVVTTDALRHTHLTKLLWHHTGALTGSRADLLRLGALFRLAAVSPHTAVFLPLRANEVGGTVSDWAERQGLADLLVARRDTNLRPAHWPAIRARLRRSAPTTIAAPAPRGSEPDLGHRWRRRQLSAAEHAETVMLSGWPEALFAAGDELTWCGNEVAGNRDIRRYGGPALLGQFNGPGDRSRRRDESWECMILAEDPLFRRAGRHD
jgi:hypothetical protein